MFSNQNPKLSPNLKSLNNLMPIILYPTLNIIKLQLAFPDNFQKLPRSHSLQLPLSKSNGHGTHFPLNIQLFSCQGFA